MKPGELDAAWMDRALELAARAYGCTSPNPLVGAVLTAGAEVVGEGFHRQAGAAHAETIAIDAFQQSAVTPIDSTSHLTLYVNLEPCSHHGRTPPCVEAITAAGIARVVAAIGDPDPRVAGRGFEHLRSHGLVVDVGCGAAAARELNHIFLATKESGRPFVALKVARARDGSIAARDGTPVAITGDAARIHTHRLRAGHDAILVGIETLRRDRPQLDIRRHQGPGRAPRRVILDPSLRAEPAWLWPGAPVPPLVLTTAAALDRQGRRFDAVAEVVAVPQRADGRFDVAAIPDLLAARHLWSVLVEGGGRTHAGFLDAGLWDRMYVYSHTGPGLAGLEWTADAAWRRAKSTLVRREDLGLDQLAIYEPRRD